MDIATLTTAADANLATKATYVQSRVPRMAAHHSPELTWGDCGVPCDTFNMVCRERLEASTAEARVREVVTHFARAQTPKALQHFAAIVAANWSPPDPWVPRFYELAAPVVLIDESPLWYFVGYCEGEAVASVEVVLGGGVAGLYSVCTLEAYRRRGFGTALTAHALLAAKAAGCRHAILQASAEGARIYARAGFEAFGEINEYKPVI